MNSKEDEEGGNEWIDVDDPKENDNPKLDNDYLKKCLRELRNEKMLRKLVTKLDTDNCLCDFMILIRQLSEGKFSPLNIAFLLCLETSKWYSLRTTTQMRFRSVTKKFWTVVYRIVRGIGIRLFSGPKNWGQVVANVAKRGHYDPQKSNINFAVPDERYLRNMNNKLGKIIPPGGIEDSFLLIENKDNIVLLADCKRISKGLGKDNLGEENLWGFEDNSKSIGKK